MSDKKDQNLTDKEVYMEGAKDKDRTYIDGQGREMIIHSKKEQKEDVRNPLVWVIPIMVVILIIPLMIFHIGGEGGGGEQTADSGAETEESGEGSGEEGGGEEGASSGDVDAEGIAQNSCASCHGEDFSGGMGPALAGTSLGEDEFTDIVRNGQGSMPSFSEDEVSDEELTAMYDMFSE
ncbi:c-type cytochrome [Lacicoccus qingdaonensis]|uniref:Cytochrome c550 n=1 Tax=Lacicoccus qingdaonensis TaxID=576118 RepID=A0A1G9GQN5_9BACL|nr:cytochrome c [Salinicoccus qingdaonensis]SDL03010.1 cytochrome c550 [Salinicoccus qingdaonensis]